jgi:hypothetical protein
VIALAGLAPIPTKLTIETSAQTIVLSLSSNVVISGLVSPPFPGEFVQIHYITPSRSVIERTVKIDTDGSYTDRLKPDEVGTWEVSAEFKAKGYYVDSRSEKVTFAVENEKRNSVFELQVSDDGGKAKTSYPIAYIIDGANVTNISINDRQRSLDISIQPTSSSEGGTLKIELARNVIDTWQPKYQVIVDGKIGSYEELPSDNKQLRILSIPFSADAKQIQIQGTYVVPEFSQAAIVVLAVTIVALIAVHRSVNLRNMWDVWK